MLRRLFRLRKTKIWKVNNHRLKSYEVRLRGTEADGDTMGVTARRETRYECIDCEKTHRSREDFEEDDCYDVIYV